MSRTPDFDTGTGGQSGCIHKYVHAADGSLVCEKCGTQITVAEPTGVDIEQAGYMYGPEDKVQKTNRFIHRVADFLSWFRPMPRR